MVECPYCKKSNKEGAGFCGYCGKRLAEKKLPPEPPVTPVESELPTQPVTPIEPEPSEPSATLASVEKPKNKKRIAVIAIVIALLALILFFVMPGFLNGKNDSDTSADNGVSADTESSETTEPSEATNEPEVPEGQIKQSTVIKTKADGSFVSKTVLEYDEREREIAGTVYNEEGEVTKTWETSYVSKLSPEYSKVVYDSNGEYERTETLSIGQGSVYFLDIYQLDGSNKRFLYVGECTFKDGLMHDRALNKVIEQTEDGLSAIFESYRKYEYDNGKLIKEKKYTRNNDDVDENGNIVGKLDLPDSFMKGWIDYENNDEGYPVRATEYDKNGNVKYCYEYENEYY